MIELTIEVFRPLFETCWPALIPPAVFSHDHGNWEEKYRAEIPALHDPDHDWFIILAEEEGRLLGFVAWNVTQVDSGRLEMVAVHSDARGRGVAKALCTTALNRLASEGVTVVHVGTGGEEFHASARKLYESLGFTASPVVDYSRAL